MRRVRGVIAATIRSRLRVDDDDLRSRHVERSEQPEVLVGRRDDLVAFAELEPGEHDVAAVRRRRRQRDSLCAYTDELGDPRTKLLSISEDTLEPRQAAPSFAERPLFFGLHRRERRARERADAPGLQVREPLEHRELGARLLERHGGFCDTA